MYSELKSLPMIATPSVPPSSRVVSLTAEPTPALSVDNDPMIERYRANLVRTGRTLIDPDSMAAVVGSTDMGNVSYLVPSIHPMIKVAPDGVPIHSIDFATWAASPSGDQAVIDGAKSMAMTVIDLWLQADLRDRMNEAFAGRPAGVQVL